MTWLIPTMVTVVWAGMLFLGIVESEGRERVLNIGMSVAVLCVLCGTAYSLGSVL